MPDNEGLLNEGTTISSADPSPSPPPSSAAPPAAQPTSTPPPAAATPPSATGTQEPPPAGTQTPPQQPTIRDYARSQGFQNVDQFADDASFLQSVFAANQTYEQELARARQYERLWMANQQQAQAPPQAAPADPLAAFKAPEFDPRWESQLVRDPQTGELRPAPNADPTILPKYMAYKQHTQRIAEQFTRDPVDFISKIVQNSMPQQTQQMVEQRLAAMQEQQWSEGFIQQNSAWIFQQDANGRRVVNPVTRQPIPTPAGASYIRHLENLARVGVKNSQDQAYYAGLALKAELNQPAAATAAAVQTGQQQQQQLIDNMNRRTPNASGSFVNPSGGNLGPAVQNENLSLRDQLRQALAKYPDAEMQTTANSV